MTDRWSTVADISFVVVAIALVCCAYLYFQQYPEQPMTATLNNGAKVQIANFNVPSGANKTVDFGPSGKVWDTSSGTYWAPGTSTTVLNGQAAASRPRITVLFQWASPANAGTFTVSIFVGSTQVASHTHDVAAGGNLADGISERFDVPANGTISAVVFQNSTADVKITISLSEDF